MVFIIQQLQNKDSIALQLNELISTNKYTNNRLVNAENLSEEELKEMALYYLNFAKKNNNNLESNPIQPSEAV